MPCAPRSPSSGCRQAGPPPMDMPALLVGTECDRGFTPGHLPAAADPKQSSGGERRRNAVRIPAIDTLIADFLVEPVDRFTLPDRASALSESDRLFRRFALRRRSGGIPSPRPGFREPAPRLLGRLRRWISVGGQRDARPRTRTSSGIGLRNNLADRFRGRDVIGGYIENPDRGGACVPFGPAAKPFTRSGMTTSVIRRSRG